MTPPWLFTSKAVPKSAESQLHSSHVSCRPMALPFHAGRLSINNQPLKCCKNTTPKIKCQSGAPIWLSSWQPTKWNKKKLPWHPHKTSGNPQPSPWRSRKVTRSKITSIEPTQPCLLFGRLHQCIAPNRRPKKNTQTKGNSSEPSPQWFLGVSLGIL